MTIHPKKDKSSHCNKIKSKSSLKKNKMHSTLSFRKNSSFMTFVPLERDTIHVPPNWQIKNYHIKQVQADSLAGSGAYYTPIGV
jgi:hypothetical protein